MFVHDHHLIVFMGMYPCFLDPNLYISSGIDRVFVGKGCGT